MFKSFLQKRENDKRRKEFEQLSDAQFVDLLKRNSYAIKPDDVIGRLGLAGAQALLTTEWDAAKSLTEVPAWRHLLKRLAVTLAQRNDGHDFLRAFYGVEAGAPDARAIRLACLRLATVPRYDREPVLILVSDPGEPEIGTGYPMPIKFVTRERYAQVEADYRAQDLRTDWWQEDLCPAARAIEYGAGGTATLRFLWDGLGNGERYELRRLAPSLWGVVDYGELFVELE
ncbi:MAG: hypothetical protein HZB53_03060 [Chloroflexi bacterium]|nr:hypothetical protein [Chloroflexota bacterium]